MAFSIPLRPTAKPVERHLPPHLRPARPRPSFSTPPRTCCWASSRHEWLFFASDRRERLDLWRFPSVGQGRWSAVLVKQGLGRLFPLGFTNDGLYYYATLSATDDVFLADFDPGTGRVTSEVRKFTSRWDGVSAFPSYSPDGANLAYVVKRGPGPVPVHVADSLVVQSLRARRPIRRWWASASSVLSRSSGRAGWQTVRPWCLAGTEASQETSGCTELTCRASERRRSTLLKAGLR